LTVGLGLFLVGTGFSAIGIFAGKICELLGQPSKWTSMVSTMALKIYYENLVSVCWDLDQNKYIPCPEMNSQVATNVALVALQETLSSKKISMLRQFCLKAKAAGFKTVALTDEETDQAGAKGWTTEDAECYKQIKYQLAKIASCQDRQKHWYGKSKAPILLIDKAVEEAVKEQKKNEIFWEAAIAATVDKANVLNEMTKIQATIDALKAKITAQVLLTVRMQVDVHAELAIVENHAKNKWKFQLQVKVANSVAISFGTAEHFLTVKPIEPLKVGTKIGQYNADEISL